MPDNSVIAVTATMRTSIGRHVRAPFLALSLCGILLWTLTPSKANATTTTAPSSTLSLEGFDFSSPLLGLGVFTKQFLNAQQCTDYVGRSTNGGATFHSLVDVMSWNCAKDGITALLTTNGRGDVFLYGPELYVSHDDAETWSRSPQPGAVLDVDAVGPSVWIVVSMCSNGQSVTGASCPVALRTSSDGGRTWTTSSARPKGVSTGISGGAQGQTYLLRPNRRVAYLMLAPSANLKGGPSVAPLWYSSNGGATWTSRHVPCGIGASSAVLSAAPNGTLMAVCASQPSVGEQIKSVLESANRGRTWMLKTRSDIDNGYLGDIDLVSPHEAYLVGGRSSLLVTHDGGTTWRAVEPLIGSSAGGTFQVVFFDATHGLVLGNDDNDNERLTLWSTTDGGRTWRTEPTSAEDVRRG